MSLRPYPKYNDSGAEWLGEVPEHWRIKRLGTCFRERRQKVSDKDFPPLSVTMSGIVPQIETAAKTDDGDNRKRVCVGDFVINSRSDRRGSSGVSPLDGSVSLINTVLMPDNSLDSQFVHHLLRSRPFQEEFYRYGKGIVADLWSTNYSEMRNIVLALPSTEEQSCIAKFLSHELKKTDALVEEQQRLIELLKDKRQTVISHAVTKGLNPNVLMKDPDIEWVGDVPKHWCVSRIKHFATRVTDGAHVSAETENGEYYFVSTKDVSDRCLDFAEAILTSARSYATLVSQGCRPNMGDVLFSKDGALVGKTVVVREDVEFVVASSLIIISPDPALLLPDFLYYLCQSSLVREQIDYFVKGAALPRLSIRNLLRFSLIFPPLQEQAEIVSFLNQKTTEIDDLTSSAAHAIDLLEERRTALISAAVTGKIDVRGMAKGQRA